MKTATKKISTLLFILLGFTPLLFVLLFAIKQQSIRHRMKERMEEQSLYTISLADNEIHWIKEGKEIWVQGRMFDIKSTEYKDGRTTFHGLFDDEETVLCNAFNKVWEKNEASQNQLLSALFECLQDIYFTQRTDIPATPQQQHHLATLQSPKLLSPFKTILTPPPQV